MLAYKRYDLEGFASYAQQVKDIQAEREGTAESLSFIDSLHQILITNDVNVPYEHRGLVVKVHSAWSKCDEILREAEQFVMIQTPLKAQGLQAHIEVNILCVEIVQLVVVLYKRIETTFVPLIVGHNN